MKSEHKQPLMLAYIIFLIISIIYYCFSKLIGYSFEAWENIVAAATIASYYFTFASGCLLHKRINHFHIQYLHKSITYIEEIEKDPSTINNLELVALAKEEKRNINNEITKKTKATIATTVSTFSYQVLGFLSFFCVLTINPLSEFIKTFQDVFTLAAFALLMVLEYIESTKMKDFEEGMKEYCKSKEDTIALLKIKNKMDALSEIELKKD